MNQKRRIKLLITTQWWVRTWARVPVKWGLIGRLQLVQSQIQQLYQPDFIVLFFLSNYTLILVHSNLCCFTIRSNSVFLLKLSVAVPNRPVRLTAG